MAKAMAAFRPGDPPEDEIFKDLKAAIFARDKTRTEEVLASLKKRDKEKGFCTLNKEDGNSLLRSALQKHREIAESLLDYDFPVNRLRNLPCNSPLHLAVKKNDLKMVKKLLIKGAHVRAKNSLGKSVLYTAVEFGFDEIVKELLKYDQPEVKIKDKYIPIDLAAANGNEKIFNLLVKSGAKADLQYCDGTLIFHVAVEEGYERTVRTIIEQKKYDTADVKNNQLLYAAVMKSDDYFNRITSINIVNMLIDAEFPIDPKKINDAEFAHIAVKNGFSTIVSSLIKLGLDPNIVNSEGNKLLITACSSEKADIVKLLIENNADITVKKTNNGESVLYWAIQNLHSSNDKTYSANYNFYSHIDGDEKFMDDKNTCCSNEWFEIIKMLVDRGININEVDSKHDKLTPLHYVARENYRNEFYHYIEELTTFLLQAGADINARDFYGNTPLQYAIIKGRLEMVKLLLPSTPIDNDHYSNNQKRTLLHSAAQSKTHEIIKMLLKREEFKNLEVEENGYNMTPLSLAVHKNQVKAVEALLQHGANVNTVDKGLKTPLYYATTYSHGMIFKMLLANNANPNCISEEGQTPLVMAAKNNDDFSINHLLKYGADIDLRSGLSGKTVLHYLGESNEEVNFNILNIGADINRLTNDNKTVLDLIEEAMISNCNRCKKNIEPVNFHGWYTRTYRKHAKIIINHILQLQAIDSFVCDENLYAMYNFEDKYGWIDHNVKDEGKKTTIDEMKKMCEAEVELMKTTFFVNTNVSIYHILTKCPHRIANNVLKNENVLKQLQTPACIEKFPIYSRLLEGRIEKCLERKEILDQDIDYSFHNVFSSLPPVCIQEILRFLSNYDLKVLIGVCQSPMDYQDFQPNTEISIEAAANHVAKKQKCE
ncbi:serine/threonine-protein phosphatase 6 regulatory ankyrin repeat subunit B-like [Cotesia glomerata]|uniref:PRANC domain-containing protein n=1 Tax=Cotesia glomerata TaxID=32391 RepID=A0AAV7I1W7_COTGL|nr:serine/threonine-protein phosphatase 6 regulatory ankyrin repeat subunit B-like [Cotesia glomerata]XP_044576311.1 serine/threonine-protein phosphatase 6 regulatory ankyrin repeat subunit B-like [Cotesia glomerata]KAH0539793.1 hypothetical protein KQX54_008065 [Cotesia glomerata]